MKKIIVPIDFSEHSEYALKTAAQLAKQYDAEVLALHMLEMSDIMLTASEGLQNQKAAYFFKLAEQKFEAFLDKDYLKGINIIPIVKHFKVFSEVNDVAKKNDADLIVMGSHGVSGVKEFFIGSNTERVVRHADIPVLVIKNNIPEVNFKEVVFACDFSEESIRPYINAVKVFEKMGSKMHLVYVNLPNERFKNTAEIEADVTNFLKKADVDLNRLQDVNYVSDYTAEDGILNFANKISADLIAIPTHGRKGLSHFFEGSIGEDITNHAKLPVMTFKI
ncbi:universal stress protein [Snuella sedimenti]|uniref:Universal stress protein n=1 Tax=Snuella sedimenti TaxID=2798802 RepID=A0A8J7II46_9FLAO|nr:universal stress protein [Snuella sedimenti]MBJ6368701.1 universal stress protein [Snuella sedimenti]